MTVSQIDLSPPSGAKAYINTDLDETVSAIDSTSGTIYAITVDNEANAAVTYLKLWNVASGSVTVGTTAPDWVFQIAASTKTTISIPEGLAYGTALSGACVTTAGTAGTTGPTSAVEVRITYS